MKIHFVQQQLDWQQVLGQETVSMFSDKQPYDMATRPTNVALVLEILLYWFASKATDWFLLGKMTV